MREIRTGRLPPRIGGVLCHRAGRLREGAHRVCGVCAPRNVPSWKLPEKAGLKREAHPRQNIRFRRDEYGMPVRKDTLICAMPESDDSTIGSMI